MDTIEDQLIRADLVVTTGGVSVGAYDVVKEVLSRLGTVRLRRGRHAAGQAAGLRHHRPGHDADLHAAGQPGQSSYVSFEVFVRPAIRRMLGVEPLHRADGARGCARRR